MHQAIYEQSEEALTVTTLNRRRPWYSFSQSDWIKKDKASEFTDATYNLSIDTRSPKCSKVVFDVFSCFATAAVSSLKNKYRCVLTRSP